MSIQELTQIQENWNNIAEGYDKYVTPTGNWALPKEALKHAGLRPGMHFLDVASGSGALSIPAARMGAQVVAVDISPAMIEQLSLRAHKEGLSNLEGRIMDGHNLELEDNTFDIAGSQFGVMLFPDLLRGLRELVRVTKPEGRVLLVAYGPPPNVEFLGLFINAMNTVLPGFTGPPMNPPPLPFQVADRNVLHQKMAEAGLKEIRIEPSTERMEFKSGRDMWNWVTNSNPIAVDMVSDLTDKQIADVQQVLDDILQERSGGKEAAVLKADVNIAIGIK